MGFKTFAAGDILTASDTQSYLMNQSVMYFSTAGARNSAITSPITGMVALIGTGGQLTYYNGSAWVDLAWGTTVAYTPTVTGITSYTATGTYTRIGNVVIANVNVSLTSAATGAIEVSLPVALSSATRFTGSGHGNCAGTTYLFYAVASSGNARHYALNASGSYASVALTSPTVPATWASGNTLVMQYIYEVA